MTTVAFVTSTIADALWLTRCATGALTVVDAAPADVIVASADCLAAVVDHLPSSTPIVAIADPAAPPERVAHVITRAWPDDQVRTLLAALAAGRPYPEIVPPPPNSPQEARDAQRVIAAARKIAAAVDLVGCETTTVEILIELLEVDRAYCMYYDDSDGSLWSEAKRRIREDERHAITGLAGFAARTGVVAVTNSAGDDPRFVGAIDDPAGDSSDRLIAQPVFGSDGCVHAVLVCARRARRRPFAAGDHALLARLARLITPVLDQLSIDVHAQAILDDAASDDGLFRRQAIDAQAQPKWGDVVRVSPPWLSWAYWLLVVLLAGSSLFAALGTVSTYSAGPAVIRSTARMPITARSSGSVVAVEIDTNDRAEVGTVIARLDDTDQRAALDRLSREFDTQLRNHMLDPADAAADASLRAIRNQLEAARTAVDERVIRATSAGVVGDIRVKPGQHVQPGDIVASVLDAARGLEVIALLPFEDRPQLAPGMSVRLELAGYRYVYQSFTISSVSSEGVGPSEARRVLGEVAESLPLSGSVVIVRGRLPSEQFELDGEHYRYHDGMLGTAEVPLREEPIIFALVPGTRRLR